MTTHYNQPVRRKAEVIVPQNILKAKVGYGGLSEAILDKAEDLIKYNTVDFAPLAELYLQSLLKAIHDAKGAIGSSVSDHSFIEILHPTMQLKANGGMFHYPLVTEVAHKLLQFIEVIDRIDDDAIEIMLAFHTTIRAVVLGRVEGGGGRHGEILLAELEKACFRYFEKQGSLH